MRGQLLQPKITLHLLRPQYTLRFRHDSLIALTWGPPASGAVEWLLRYLWNVGVTHALGARRGELGADYEAVGSEHRVHLEVPRTAHGFHDGGA